MGIEQTLERTVHDAKTGGDNGDVINEDGIAKFSVCHIQLVVDIP